MSRSDAVLIIDDDTSLRRVMEFALSDAGIRVLTAENGQQGLQVFASERPPVVITDIQMPGLSGYDVLKKIRADDPECLVIIVTAFGTVEKAVKAMKDGAFDYMTKPFGNDELILVVRRALSYRGLRLENQRLRQEMDDRDAFRHLVGMSDSMQRVFDLVRRVSGTGATVLIEGESGTGKELIARAIHHHSDRCEGPFVPVNCAAIPRELLESELFGHLKGAFTGAVRDRKGKFELADGGTLFLDEVGELSPELQPKLLRALQEMEIEPVGAGVTRKIDVRVVAATNRDLDSDIREKRFREDLYYRLSVIPLSLPPLRDRKDDIPLLVRHFLKRFVPDEQAEVSPDAMKLLVDYDWPGNVRELENSIQQMSILRRGNTIGPDELPPKFNRSERSGQKPVVRLPETGYPLADLEKEVVLQALEHAGWNQTRAADLLCIPRHTLVYRMEKYHLKKERI